MRKIKVPRIIYNDDTCSLRYVPKPHTEEKIYTAVDYLKGTQVDVLCWCMCTQLAYAYRSKRVENFFDKLERAHLAGYLGWKEEQGDLLMSLYQKGIDYLPLLINRTHENGIRFFASFRMNDCHLRSAPESPLTPDFWKKHQRYRLWGVTDSLSYYNGLLDYSYAPVRKRMVDMIFEVAKWYDIDGVELDLGREPYYFQPSEAWRKRRILTGFVKTVRRQLEKIAKKKGKEIQLLIRTPFSEERLKKGGMDVWTWVQRRYIDILAMNSKTCRNDYNQRVGPFLSLCRNAGILLYGSIENGPVTNSADYPSIAKVRHNYGVPQTVDETIKSQRAMAKNLLEQGADGIHMFNYPCILFEGKTYYSDDRQTFNTLVSVLSEMGSLKTLARTDKEYCFFNDLPVYAESNRPREFHQTISFNIFGRDTMNAKKVTLSCRQIARPNPHAPGAYVQNPLVPHGYVDYYLNDEKVPPRQIKITKKRAGKIPSGFELAAHHLVEINLDPRKIRNGENTLAFEIPRFPEARDPYVYFYELKVNVTFLRKKKKGE